MQSCEFVMAISALACCIAEGRSQEELAFISAVLTQLGDTLTTITARQDFCSGKDT